MRVFRGQLRVYSELRTSGVLCRWRPKSGFMSPLTQGFCLDHRLSGNYTSVITEVVINSDVISQWATIRPERAFRASSARIARMCERARQQVVFDPRIV